MTEKRDGGPAFPQSYAPPLMKVTAESMSRADASLKDAYGPGEFIPVKVEAVGQGMSLRDFFAAHALQAIIAAVSSGSHTPDDIEGDRQFGIAVDAYSMADAMLKARETSHG